MSDDEQSHISRYNRTMALMAKNMGIDYDPVFTDWFMSKDPREMAKIMEIALCRAKQILDKQKNTTE